MTQFPYRWFAISLMLGLALSLNAQITLTTADLMMPGKMLNEYVDTTTNVLNLGGTGSNQVWDYSTLTEDTIWNSDILPPSSLPRASRFPGATAAIERFGLNYQYYKSSLTETEILGSAVIIPNFDTLVFQQNYKFIEFPTTLGSKVSDAGDGNFFFKYPTGGFDPDGPGPHPNVDSVATFTVDMFEGEIDASGTITTPIYQYQALRQYSKSTSIDSAYMYASGKWQAMSSTMASAFMIPLVETDTSYTYAWMVKEGGLPVMVIEFDPYNDDEILIAQWTDHIPVGIAENKGFPDLHLYPNPVVKDLTLENAGDEDLHYTLNTLNGKQIAQGSFRGSTKIPLENLSKGSYVLLLDNGKGRREARKILK